jgi:hypothetical protein
LVTFYDCILEKQGALEFVLFGHIWGYDYGFLNGRENMDTQLVRMLDVAHLRADTAAEVLGAQVLND